MVYVVNMRLGILLSLSKDDARTGPFGMFSIVYQYLVPTRTVIEYVMLIHIRPLVFNTDPMEGPD